ncbi:hypothetical protein LPY66_11380 [Dehalobacter sp. DCM]|uniref:hypothetical protein n=1 Tax=Dehalobacter sp. DCM TaxID=2907827 RepID=UPI003081A5E8|nr:hypothetical protein LPY66_11380 [Dehalobacter sp. DCM]
MEKVSALRAIEREIEHYKMSGNSSWDRGHFIGFLHAFYFCGVITSDEYDQFKDESGINSGINK